MFSPFSKRFLPNLRLLLVVSGSLFMLMLPSLKRLSPYCLDHHNAILLSRSNSDVPDDLWVQPNLLDIQNFEFVFNNEWRCHYDSNRSHVQTKILVVLVHSHRSNFRRRDDIRKSWGSAPVYKEFDLRLVFLLGMADQGVTAPEQDLPAVETRKLEKEQELNGDLVIGNFVDSFGNLTYKHMMGYKWILNFCQRAALVLKVDEDQFTDIFRWINLRVKDLENQPRSAPDLYCAPMKQSPSRGEGSQLDVTCDEWPLETYPDFCNGIAYGITVDLIKELYSMTTRVRFLRIDDVYATGVLLEAVKKFGWTPKMKDISPWAVSKSEDCQAGSGQINIEAATIGNETGGMISNMMCLWRKLINNTKLDSTLKTFTKRVTEVTSLNSTEIIFL